MLRGHGDDEALYGSFGKFLEELVVCIVEGRPVEMGVDFGDEGVD